MGYKDKDKQRKYQRDWCRARRIAWFKEVGPYKGCGAKSVRNMEVDHKDESKKVTHRVWSLCKEKREAELKKCQPLCKKCHLKKSRAYISIRLAMRKGIHYPNRKNRLEIA